MQYFILSNNTALPPTLPPALPSARASTQTPEQAPEQTENMPVRRVAGGIDDFYTALGTLLQNNCELISAPLPPNVPLIRSPVRSVIVRMSRRKYDTEGLLLLEKAQERSAALGVAPANRLLRDLERIDKDHICRAIRQLREVLDFEGTELPA